MNRSASPGLGQWITVSLMVTITMFLLYKIYEYAGSRSYYPTGLSVAGINVGGLTRAQASEAIANRYIDAPIILYHGNDTIEMSPTRAEFTPDIAAMLSEADYQRSQQDFWAGFWGFLWGRPVEVEPVPLQATHNRDMLLDFLRGIALLADQPAQPPQPVPGTLTFQYGTSGTVTDIEASFADVEAALYRPGSREARLVVQPRNPERPSINLLTRLLVNRLQVFEQETGGVASVFIMDLATGEEVVINGAVPMSGIDLMKIPIVLEAYRTLDQLPSLTQRQLISDTLVVQPANGSANELLNLIAGEENPYLGAQVVTDSMRRLGLVNTFMVAPYDQPALPNRTTLDTPANTAAAVRTRPNPLMQTTAEDMGILLSMLYYCAYGNGGALLAAYAGQLTADECQQQIDYMTQNTIGSLIEEGTPPGTRVAHRHGWISDTHGDAGIVFSPGGDYVIVEFLYKPNWLEWEISSPLLAEISRAAYNYFNFDNPYVGDSRSN